MLSDKKNILLYFIMAKGLTCWSRKNRAGKLYRVCNKSKGQKGVYKKVKKGKTAKKVKGKKRGKTAKKTKKAKKGKKRGKTAKKRTPLALRRLR